jgi:hypothetical protein
MTRVLVMTGGLIHLVHQLAVLTTLPETQHNKGKPATIAVLVTGVLTKDAAALGGLQQTLERWFTLLRQRDPSHFERLHLVRQEADLPAEGWDLCLLNNQWVSSQRSVLERLDIPELVVCGDGLGLYYRCARELRAVLPSLLNRPIPESSRRVRYVLSGRQPIWHRPPQAATAPPDAERARLFALLVESQRQEAATAISLCLSASDPPRPLWLCSVPNLAHQFPEHHIPLAVLEGWQRRLVRRHGFDPRWDRLLLIDHPKAPPDGSFGSLRAPWLAEPLRSAVALEVLVQLLRERHRDRRIVVAGLTSALYGVQKLTGAEVAWLGLGPLWRGNLLYRRRPLEFLHRWLRVVRMAKLTSQ